MNVQMVLVRRLALALWVFTLLVTSSIAPTPAQAEERSCRQERQLRSLNSNTPTKITFVNTSGMYRSVNWIDFKGQTQSYGGLNPGETKTFDTYATHVWVIATGPGDCLQIFIARAQPLIVEVPRMAVDGPRPKAAPVTTPVVCAPNYTRVRGECVPKQNCGPNAFRNVEGDCDCNRGFAMRNGQCARIGNTNCKRTEVYSSSMGQCVPIAATCSPNEVYSSSVNACIPRQTAPRPCPRGMYLNQLGVCQPNQTGG
jgi:hypothetical protein